MTVLALVIALIICGILLYLVGLLPLDPAVLRVIRAVVLIAVVLCVIAVVAGWLGVVVPHSWRGVWR